jgi:hypothetical protein
MDSIYPLNVCLILRGNTPICSVPNSKDAVVIVDALAAFNYGQEYTCIAPYGHFTKIIEAKNDIE